MPRSLLDLCISKVISSKLGVFLKATRIVSILQSTNTEDRDGPPYQKNRSHRHIGGCDKLQGIRCKTNTLTMVTRISRSAGAQKVGTIIPMQLY